MRSVTQAPGTSMMPLVASLLLVVRPGAPSSFLFLVAKMIHRCRRLGRPLDLHHIGRWILSTRWICDGGTPTRFESVRGSKHAHLKHSIGHDAVPCRALKSENTSQAFMDSVPLWHSNSIWGMNSDGLRRDWLAESRPIERPISVS